MRDLVDSFIRRREDDRPRFTQRKRRENETANMKLSSNGASLQKS